MRIGRKTDCTGSFGGISPRPWSSTIPALMQEKESDIRKSILWPLSRAAGADEQERHDKVSGCRNVRNNKWSLGFGSCDLNYKSPAIWLSLCFSIKSAQTICSIWTAMHRGTLIHVKKLLKLIGRWTDIFGEATYERKPYPTKSLGNSFIYWKVITGFIFLWWVRLKMRMSGEQHKEDAKPLTLWKHGKNICWMDNSEALEFMQKGNVVCEFSAQSSGMSFAYV